MPGDCPTPPCTGKVIMPTCPHVCAQKYREKYTTMSTNSYHKRNAKPLYPRESAKLISSKSQDVSICIQGVKEASKVIFDCLKSKKYSFKIWKEHELHPKEMTESTVDWIAVLDTLNFSFWTEENVEPWTVRFEGRNYTGYWALCASINRALKVNMNRRVHALQCIMGNQGKMERNSKVCVQNDEK